MHIDIRAVVRDETESDRNRCQEPRRSFEGSQCRRDLEFFSILDAKSRGFGRIDGDVATGDDGATPR